MYPKNLSSRISIDETSLSNGELHTIITNKAAKGKKHSVIAIIKGTQSDFIIEKLLKIAYSRRKIVKEVTVDMSASLNRVIRMCFPAATVVTDRFHVQQLANDALQDLRIGRRWEVLEQENERYRQAKLQGTDYEPRELENGETLKRLMVNSRFALMKPYNKLYESQKARLHILLRLFPDIRKGYCLVQQLRNIYNRHCEPSVARLRLAKWYDRLIEAKLGTFKTVAETLEKYNCSIINYFENRATNAAAESFNAKIKAFRAQFRGVADIPFFLFRVCKIYA